MITSLVGPHEPLVLLGTIKRKKLAWLGHVTRPTSPPRQSWGHHGEMEVRWRAGWKMS